MVANCKQHVFAEEGCNYKLLQLITKRQHPLQQIEILCTNLVNTHRCMNVSGPMWLKPG
jgi:hypothetical protein